MANVKCAAYVRPRRGRKAASHRLRGKLKARIDCACVHDPRINLSCAIGHLPLTIGHLPNVSLGWVLDTWHWPFAICDLLFAKSNVLFFFGQRHVSNARWHMPNGKYPNGQMAKWPHGQRQMPHPEWQMPNYKWPMVNRQLQMANGTWQMPNGTWPMSNGQRHT